MSEIMSPLVYQLGIGGIGGFIVGFTIKKISKLLMVLLGLFIIALLYLGTSGIISINYEALWEAVANGLGIVGQMTSWIIDLVSLIPFMGSFLVGFLLGLKMG